MGILGKVLGVGGALIGGAVGGPVGAKIGGAIGGAVGGAASSSGASKKATKAQIEAEKRAEAIRQQNLTEVKGLQAPGLQAYNTGLNALTGRLGLTPTPVAPPPAAPAPAQPAAASVNALTGKPVASGPGLWGAIEGVVQGQQAAPGGVPSPAALPASVAPQASPLQPTGALPTAPSTPAQATGTPGTYGTVSSPTAPEAFSYGLDDYEASPGYNYQQEQGQKAILASSAATGALRSGAALKALQDRGQQIAYQDFGNERQFARGLWDTNRDVYENDRNYLTNRYDQGTSDLFRYTGVGENALRATTGAITGAAQDGAQSAINTGQFQAQNALAQGGITSGLVSNLAGLAASAFGGGLGGGKTSPTANTVPYDPSMVNLSGYKPPSINPFSF